MLICPWLFKISLFSWFKLLFLEADSYRDEPHPSLSRDARYIGFNVLEAAIYDLVDPSWLVKLNGVVGLLIMLATPYASLIVRTDEGLAVLGYPSWYWVCYIGGYTVWNVTLALTQMGDIYATQPLIALPLTFETQLDLWPFFREYSLFVFLMTHRLLVHSEEACVSFPFGLRAWVLGSLIGIGFIGSLIGAILVLTRVINPI